MFCLETILLKNVDKIFGRSYKKDSFNRNTLGKELKHLYGVANEFVMREDKKARHFRILNNYYTLKKNIRGAMLLRKIKEMLELTGEFDSLDKILVSCYFIL